MWLQSGTDLLINLETGTQICLGDTNPDLDKKWYELIHKTPLGINSPGGLRVWSEVVLFSGSIQECRNQLTEIGNYLSTARLVIEPGQGYDEPPDCDDSDDTAGDPYSAEEESIIPTDPGGYDDMPF